MKVKPIALLCSVQFAAIVFGGSVWGAEGVATHGSALFAQICARCHGPNMVNPGTLSFDLRKFPDDKPRFIDSVTNGKNNMPAFKGLLTESELDDIYAYIRTGGKKN